MTFVAHCTPSGLQVSHNISNVWAESAYFTNCLCLSSLSLEKRCQSRWRANKKRVIGM